MCRLEYHWNDTRLTHVLQIDHRASRIAIIACSAMRRDKAGHPSDRGAAQCEVKPQHKSGASCRTVTRQTYSERSTRRRSTAVQCSGAAQHSASSQHHWHGDHTGSNENLSTVCAVIMAHAVAGCCTRRSRGPPATCVSRPSPRIRDLVVRSLLAPGLDTHHGDRELVSQVTIENGRDRGNRSHQQVWKPHCSVLTSRARQCSRS